MTAPCCPGYPHEHRASSQAGLQALINRVPGPAVATVQPTREALVAAIGHEAEWCSLRQSEPATDGSCCDAGRLADAVLAILPGRTEAEVKAEALDEAAELLYDHPAVWRLSSRAAALRGEPR